MRKLIARITGWPLVGFNWGYDQEVRFAEKYEDGSWFIKAYGKKMKIDLNDTYRDFKPIMNCRKHGVNVFKDYEK